MMNQAILILNLWKTLKIWAIKKAINGSGLMSHVSGILKIRTLGEVVRLTVRFQRYVKASIVLIRS